MRGHVVWDWNGTLFDDFTVNVAAVAETCRSVCGVEVSEHDYRTHYRRPITAFYEALLGRPLEAGEWERLNDGYFEEYRRRLVSARLAHGAMEALAAVEASGFTQSLLSMWEHDELLALVARFSLGRFFVRVDGQAGPGGEGKRSSLARHLERLEERRPALSRAAVVVVGDSVDDADAARSLGLACVLVSGGPHHPDALRATGAPVVDGLAEAVARVLSDPP